MVNNQKKQKDKLIQDLDVQIHKIEGALTSLKGSVEELMAGDQHTPYWNGNNACSLFKNLLTQVDVDQNLLQDINECKSLIKKS